MTRSKKHNQSLTRFQFSLSNRAKSAHGASIFILRLIVALTAVECSAQSTIVPYAFSTIAGGAEGFADGPGAVAEFEFSTGLAVDSMGNIYVADTDNSCIRKMTLTDGQWVVTTIGVPNGFGYADSTDASNAMFCSPQGVAVDALGNVYIADTGNNLIRKLSTTGAVTTIAGNTQMIPNGESGGDYNNGYQDGPGDTAQFDFPYGLAIDASGNLYVGDSFNSAIRKITFNDQNVWEVSTLAGGYVNSPFYGPAGVAVDRAGYVYVADPIYNRIDKVSPNGEVTVLAGFIPTIEEQAAFDDGIAYPSQDGTGADAGFDEPAGVAVDALTNVYVADSWDGEIRKITPDGAVTTIGGAAAFYKDLDGPSPVPAFADGTGSSALFYNPCGVAVDTLGNVYVADTWNCRIRKGVSPVVLVTAMEITQVIQDWNNSVPLVQGKETYLRAYLQLPLTASSTLVSGARLYGTAQDGSPLPDSPTEPINLGSSLYLTSFSASNSSVRATIAKTLNFRLPPAWLSGTINLQLRWPGVLQPINVVPQKCMAQASFVPVAVPQIKFFDVVWTDMSGNTHQLGANIYDLPNRVLSCYPVPAVDATYGTFTLPGKQAPDFGSPQHQFSSLVNSKISDLRNIDTMLSQINVVARDQTQAVGNRIYHGAFQADPIFDMGYPTNIDGLAQGPLPSFVSCGNVLGTYSMGRQTASHEICHNLGEQHDVNYSLFYFFQIANPLLPATEDAVGACGEVGPKDWIYPLFNYVDGFGQRPTLGPLFNPDDTGDNSLIYGLDSVTLRTTRYSPILSPIEIYVGDTNCYYDLMSYCRNGGIEDVWPSTFTYTGLIDQINGTFGGGSADDKAKAIATRGKHFTPVKGAPYGSPVAQGYLIVRGTVDFVAGTAQFLPCLQFAATNPPPEESSGTNFALEAYDGSGNVLQTIQFALQPTINESASQNSAQTAGFMVSLTNNSSIHTLVLTCNGQTLAALTATPAAPSLSLTFPNGGQTFTGGTANVTWSASDSDGDSLSYTVQYSADNGGTWQTLAIDWPNETLPVNTAQLAATTQGLMRVMASDGFNTATVQSAATFTVQPHAPAVSINAPMDGSIFMGDQQLFLDASANDMQDGPLSGANVQWYSDRDGLLGAGTIVNFDAKLLSEGNHTITVTATDSAGLTNSAETQVLVLHYQPPQLTFQVTPGVAGFSPPDGNIFWPSYYTNYALQSSSNLASAWAAITNLPEAAGNQCMVNVAVSNRTSYYRLILQP